MTNLTTQDDTVEAGKDSNLEPSRTSVKRTQSSVSRMSSKPAISQMNIQEIIDGVNTGRIELEENEVFLMHDRFVGMTKLERRKFYKCGESFLIPDEIPAWEEFGRDLPSPDIRGQNCVREVNEILNQKVAIWKGDITLLEVDCTVNVTDMMTSSFGGVSSAIREDAGPLQKAELSVLEKVGVGECVATAGYQLPAKYLLHTSGPSRDICGSDWAVRLQRCYRACLNELKQLRQQTLAFPCISSGSKGMPKETCADIAMATVRDWLLEEDNINSVTNIIFSVIDEENWDLYCSKMFNNFPLSEMTSPASSVSHWPVEILRMDSHSRDLYKSALSEGKENYRSIRVMVVGHSGVGKTTLTRRLLGDTVDLSVKDSTSGIDVHVNRCDISLSDNVWHRHEPDERPECAATKQLARSLSQHSRSDTFTLTGGSSLHDLSISSECSASYDIINDVIMNFFPGSPIDNADQSHGIERAVAYTQKNEKEEGEDQRCLDDLMHLIQTGQSQTTDDLVNLSVWDFAGQYVYYTTHQLFLSPRVVYLLVTDISKHTDDIVQDDVCFFDCSGRQQWSISEFLEFWLNSIHSYTSVPGHSTGSVILVGTHADKLCQNTQSDVANMKESRHEKAVAYFEAVRNHLSDKPTRYHLADEDFDIDNTSVDPGLEDVRRKIIDVAKQQPYWNEEIPTKWLPLEKALWELRRSDKKIVDRRFIDELNSTMTVPISSSKELELFLRFQHELGAIVYFRDDNLRDRVVLDPSWLLDALKSLITAKSFCMKQPHVIQHWQEFSTRGILRPQLLDAVWQRGANSSFHDNRAHLIALMEKLNLIAQPLLLSEDDTYYLAPCMLKEETPASLHVPPDNSTSSDCKTTPVLVFSADGNFIPTAVFHRLMSSCISKWPLWREGKKDMIFSGCAVFRLDATHKLTVLFREFTVQVWVSKFGLRLGGPSRKICFQVRELLEDNIKRIGNCLTPNTEYVVGIRCPKSTLTNTEHVFPERSLKQDVEIVCCCHGNHHVVSSQELLRYWSQSSENVSSEDKDSCLPDTTRHRFPTDKDLGDIAARIGKEYQQLGIALGVTDRDIETITRKHQHVPDRIRKLLLLWTERGEETATFGVLEQTMRSVNIDTLHVFKSWLR